MIEKYLKRIGFEGEIKHDVETLSKLQHHHLLSIPYENLDIMRDIPLSLEVEDMYEKMINKQRGGYCFELNGLYAWLLKSLGFEVTEYMARFFEDEPDLPPMRRHRVLGVKCNEGLFLSDVGVGLVIPRFPIEIKTGIVFEQDEEKYKLEEEEFFGFMLYKFKRGEWHKLYSFTQEPQLEKDFIMPTFYCENYPDSFFRSMDMVHIFTEKGRKSVARREVKIFEGENVTVINPKSEEEYYALLKEHFNIVI